MQGASWRPLYDLALAAGALGGKLSGAGGGGTLMFIVPPDRRLAVIRSLEAAGAAAHGAETWVV